MNEIKVFWLKRRLKELGKTQTQLAAALGVRQPRLSDLEKGCWNLKIEHVRKAASFLNFDTLAFLDFVSGRISEEELWNATTHNASSNNNNIPKDELFELIEMLTNWATDRHKVLPAQLGLELAYMIYDDVKDTPAAEKRAKVYNIADFAYRHSVVNQ